MRIYPIRTPRHDENPPNKLARPDKSVSFLDAQTLFRSQEVSHELSCSFWLAECG
jgi:hypothetical protein